ncbi:hypothetical protein [Emticicia sp. C21]|uniref:hypothetical protein n=1 Tax=Emticicia sp. C21 TaxID=2302915 RepID=UPI000E349AC3|nr:hypothetical protein [Emticicia sp. C21]RFS17821.1 hypothetical protein D0T08_00810 [Emticicia sp. C21]
MKTNLCITLIILLNTCVLIAQDNPKNMGVSDLANAVVMLYERKNGQNESRGTGNIVSYHNKYLLITARHIAEQMSSTAKIVFMVPDSSAIEEDLIFLTSSIAGIPWIHHPLADISILEIAPFNDFQKDRFLSSSIKLDWVASQKISFPIGTEALFFGFPMYVLNHYFSPIALWCNTASKLITHSDKVNYIYLDRPSIQSCSGSGVFITIRKGSFSRATYMVGIISATLSDDTGGKLAAVVPISYLKELLLTIR